MVIVPPKGGLESRWDSRKRQCFIHVVRTDLTSKLSKHIDAPVRGF